MSETQDEILCKGYAIVSNNKGNLFWAQLKDFSISDFDGREMLEHLILEHLRNKIIKFYAAEVSIWECSVSSRKKILLDTFRFSEDDLD